MTIFSKIIKGEIPSYTIAEDENFYAFLDIFPAKLGHTLIVPKIEIDKIFELPTTYLSKILVFAQPIAVAIKLAYPCNRINIITVGLEVPHAHIHLIPTNNVLDMNITNSKLELNKATLREVQNKIKSFL